MARLYANWDQLPHDIRVFPFHQNVVFGKRLGGSVYVKERIVYISFLAKLFLKTLITVIKCAFPDTTTGDVSQCQTKTS